MAQLLLSPVGILVQQLANSGQPLSGGQIFIYVAGTTTPQTTYTDSTGTTPNANPIVLNSAGRLPNVSVWVNSNTPHKLVLQDANSVTLSTIDQLYGINDPFLINQVSSVLPTAGGTANALTVANPTPITSQGLGTEQWFVPGLANTGPAAVVIDGLPSLSIFYLSKALTGGELQPGVPVLIKNDGTRYNLAWSAKGPAADAYFAGGTANAITVTANQVQSGVIGLRYKISPLGTNTTAPTLNVNGRGAEAIYYADGVTPIAPGAFIGPGGSGQTTIYDIIDTGNSIYICTNPSRVTGSFTGTLKENAGATTITTGTVNYAIGQDGKSWKAWAASAIAGASAHTDMTMTGIPAALANTTSKSEVLDLENATAASIGIVLTGTSTTWTFGNPGLSGFTASGTKGLFAGSTFSSSFD